MPTPRYQPAPLAPELTAGDTVPPGDPRRGIIWIDPARMSGEPCFYGTRVPIRALFECLEAGDSLDDFLQGFPPITREHAIAVLDLARRSLFPGTRAA